jgi:hypothetical protein
MVAMLIRIHDVNRLIAALEAVLNEWEQYPVLFLFTIEKCADMACFAELGAGKGDGRRGALHGVVSYTG